MKNLYIKEKQIDKNKLYTRWSTYCTKNCNKQLLQEVQENIITIDTAIYFDKDYYNSLDKDQKEYFGDCVDSLLSGGSFAKVNSFRVYFHQSIVEPSEEMKSHITNTEQELLKFLQVYLYDYPRWKTVYYPDGVYRTHLDLIVANCWKDQEVFDITISKDNKLMLSKIVELIGLCAGKGTFDCVNVLNLYTGRWYSYRLNSNEQLENKIKDLFKSFVELRKNEERSNVEKDGK